MKETFLLRTSNGAWIRSSLPTSWDVQYFLLPSKYFPAGPDHFINSSSLQAVAGFFLVVMLRQLINTQLSCTWLIIAFEFILKTPLCLKFALAHKIENTLSVVLKTTTLTRKLHRLLLVIAIFPWKRRAKEAWLFLTYIYISLSLQSWLSYVANDFRYNPHLIVSPEIF